MVRKRKLMCLFAVYIVLILHCTANQKQVTMTTYSSQDFEIIDRDPFRDFQFYDASKEGRLSEYIKSFNKRACYYYKQCYYLTGDSYYLSLLAYISFIDYLDSRLIRSRVRCNTDLVAEYAFSNDSLCQETGLLTFFENPLLWEKENVVHVPLPKRYEKLTFKQYGLYCRDFMVELRRLKLEFKKRSSYLQPSSKALYRSLIKIGPFNQNLKKTFLEKIKEVARFRKKNCLIDGLLAEAMSSFVLSGGDLHQILSNRSEDIDFSKMSKLIELEMIGFYHKCYNFKELKNKYESMVVWHHYKLWFNFYKLRFYKPEKASLVLNKMKVSLRSIFRGQPSLFKNPGRRESTGTVTYNRVYEETKSDYESNVEEFISFFNIEGK